MSENKEIKECIKELRECIANVYFSFCKGKFCKGCILNKKKIVNTHFANYIIYFMNCTKKKKENQL